MRRPHQRPQGRAATFAAADRGKGTAAASAVVRRWPDPACLAASSSCTSGDRSCSCRATAAAHCSFSSCCDGATSFPASFFGQDLLLALCPGSPHLRHLYTSLDDDEDDGGAAATRAPGSARSERAVTGGGASASTSTSSRDDTQTSQTDHRRPPASAAEPLSVKREGGKNEEHHRIQRPTRQSEQAHGRDLACT